MKEELMRKYARLAVITGVNIQKGQPLVITSSVTDHVFAEYCVEEAYKAGASEVTVRWSDENVSHMDFTYQSKETLCDIPDWVEERIKHEHGTKSAYLHIDSSTPGLMADIDGEKMGAYQQAYMAKMSPYMAYSMNNEAQWCIIALPSVKWAEKVFPDKKGQEAYDALNDAILYSVRVREDNDPIEEWQQHSDRLAAHCEILNENQFKELHFVSSNGTDLHVGLVKNHIWVGGGGVTLDGIYFTPNMPTEECFCMPDRNNVNGIVYASKPLSYQGKIVEDFWFRFENGIVVDYGAAKEKEALTSLLETDEGSRHLGEVALISYDSPISNLNILFLNTLFDENASCHLALGRAYPENVAGGTDMSEEELLAVGSNISNNHVDFMFGTADMSVTGLKENGEEVTVFKDGNFAF